MGTERVWLGYLWSGRPGQDAKSTWHACCPPSQYSLMDRCHVNIGLKYRSLKTVTWKGSIEVDRRKSSMKCGDGAKRVGQGTQCRRGRYKHGNQTNIYWTNHSCCHISCHRKARKCRNFVACLPSRTFTSDSIRRQRPLDRGSVYNGHVSACSHVAEASGRRTGAQRSVQRSWTAWHSILTLLQVYCTGALLDFFAKINIYWRWIVLVLKMNCYSYNITIMWRPGLGL